MRKLQEERESSRIKRVTLVGTVSLFVLLLLFFIVTLFATGQLTSQMRLLTEHPFAVNADAGDAKTCLALMRIRTERLQSYNSPEDVELVRAALAELDAEMVSKLDEIYALYLGPNEDALALEQTYERIQDAHRRFLAFSNLPTSGTAQIAVYEQENLYPLYDTFEEDVDRIITFVRGTQQRIFTSAEKMSRNAVIWSCIIILATTIGLIYFQAAIRKMSSKIFQKNCQFERLSDTIDETFMIFDKDKRQCDFVSGSAERVLGLPAESLRQDNLLLWKYMDEGMLDEVVDRIKGESLTTLDTLVQYHHPKTVMPCWLQLRFYLTGEGEGGKCIVTLTDRTKEQRSNQALQDALTSAQKANNAKRDFLSRMSHEIRTPMNAIIGMTTIAAACIEDRPKVEDCLQKISQSSKHLLMLINDVLDMSRIESKRVSINNEPFELYQFFSAFVSVVYPMAQQKGLEFTEKTIGFTEHTTYKGDTLRLNQILLNLASNAIKFTPRGGKVHIEVERLSDRGNTSWLRFVVSDTGIGMDEQGIKRLYTPFEQADETIARKYGGTGLGMSITQNLVAMMGGHIGVVSKPEEGTTFTVELPFERSDVILQPVQDETMEQLHVLVVDDERDICEHTVLLLKKMKINAQSALGGAEAVEYVVSAQKAGNDFDVCFIDWKMPDMDGVETTRRIREKVGPNTPIVIISAYDWSDIEKEAREAGVNAFIAKPMFQSSLYNMLVSVTNGSFAQSRRGTRVTSHELDGKRLLLAEDNMLNTEIAVTLLEMNGAAVEYVENGQEAVQRFLSTKPGYFDAILMDIQMPVMDGYEATHRIRECGREDARRIPIIATTANAMAEDVSAVMAAGMDAHIGKPLDMDKLVTMLSQFCDIASSME